MGLAINQYKAGMTVLLDGEVFVLVNVQHVKPGKGGAFIRTKLKNIKSGAVLERTFRNSDELEQAYIEERKLQYQYSTGDSYHFMDQETFEESVLSKEQLGDNEHFLRDNLEVTAYFFREQLLNIVLPNFVTYKIIQTEPGVRGDTAKACLKPAKIETGWTISVPLFIDIGDYIKVDTREGKYIEREKSGGE